jgi:16S rRNA (guanine527-N7)-methyltransferase
LSQKIQPKSEVRGPADFAAAFSVSRETIERLKTYESLLQRWQKTINLVAPSTLTQVWHRHFADSAQIVALAPPEPKSWIDLGSGAGFPGLVAAIMLPPGKTRVTLVESDGRKAAFLREVARVVAVPVDILPERIEIAATRASLSGQQVVTARALAPLDALLTLAQPFFGPGTTAIFLKGRDAAVEVEVAEKKWKFDSTFVPSVTDADARLVIVRSLEAKSPAK